MVIFKPGIDVSECLFCRAAGTPGKFSLGLAVIANIPFDVGGTVTQDTFYRYGTTCDIAA